MLAYEELRIRVRPIGTSRYLITANGPASAAEVIAVNGEPAAFRDEWDQLIATELGLAPLGDEHTVNQLRGLGRGVFRLLFGEGTQSAAAAGCSPSADARGGERPQGVGACVDLALDHAQRMRPARGLRIRFDLPQELRDLPLESLCAPPGMPQQSLALNHSYSLVRSLPGGPLGRRLPDAADEPSLIRLLVACASPVDPGLAPLRADAEVAALRQELPEVAVQTTVLERTTRKSLEAALGAESDLPTAVLLIAHGTYDQELGKGMVALETEGGGVDQVPADLLSGILLKAPGLRLVALNLCSGADSSLTEPFSGLAQALIGGGVPAVVAMRGRVSDLSAGQFGPELFKGLAANRTIDEAMGAARRRISHLPGHTAVEWATPALFLHENCRQGWLFKAREVRDDGGAVADPLREGADALRAFQNPFGHVDSTVLIGAARFQRDLGQWAQVQRILRAETRQFEDEQRLLRAEATFELAWEDLDKLCGLLAADLDPDAAAEQFAALRDALPAAPAACVAAEVERLRHLTTLAERARAAEATGDWAKAIARYEELLTAHPTGIRDTADRLAAARDELHVARAMETAEQAARHGAWADAAAAYADVLARRPGHQGAAAHAAYVNGRAAQDAEDWAAAGSAYEACAGLDDAAARAAYVNGREAANAEEWDAARELFKEATNRTPPKSGASPSPSPAPDLHSWLAYASARAAEDAGDWGAAVGEFTGANGFRDSGVRLSYARGRRSAEDGAWAEALTDLEAAAAQGHDAEPWLSELRNRMYQSALDAASAGHWPNALTALDLLPPAFRDVRSRKRYVQGRVAAADGDWALAAEAFAGCATEAGPGAGRGVGPGAGPGADTGRDAAPGTGSGSGSGADTGPSADTEAGPGAGPGTDAGPDTEPGAGPDAGPGTDTGPDAATGAGSGSGSGANAAPGADTEARRDARPETDAGPETEPGAGPDTDAGPDTEPGAGPDAGPGADTGPDAATGAGSGAGSGADTGPSADTEARRDAGPDADAGPEAGPGAGSGADAGSHAGSGADAEPEGGPGAGADAGSGVTGCGYDDAAELRIYALGRLHQDGERWQEALGCFSELSSDLLDVPNRLLYSRGRAADARSEWSGVIDGFGRLPDTYAHGEVRDRRRYARARVAADLRDDWSAVLSLLAEVPDTGRDGAVGQLRRKAEGRLAEAAGDWAGACEIYARAFPQQLDPGRDPSPDPDLAQDPAPGQDPSPSHTPALDEGANPSPGQDPDPDPDQEPHHLHRYALARTHELGGFWGDALAVYRALPDSWADVVVRRGYVEARIAERGAVGAAQWQGVVDAFAVVEAGPGEFADVGSRKRYALVRLAEAEGDWPRVREEADALGEHRDAASLGAYARGRIAASHQEWQQAADAFRACAGHGDAGARLAYVQGRLLEADGRWSDAVAAYERAGGGLERADVRCRRLRRLLELLPWADGLTRAPLVADPFASSDPTYPYFALRDAGVDPASSMDAVSDASYTLLERGGMTWSERVAWDRLRLPGRRLQLDALLYRWHSPAALRDAMAGLSPDDGQPGLLGDLCERFPEDAPLLLLLARDREAAAAEWERRLRDAPGDMAVVHGLAVARLWQAQELEQSGAWEHAVGVWESALAYWAALLSDDEYWDGWRAERAACYGRALPGEDMAQLRLELSQHLFGQLSAHEQRHTEQERPEQAAAYEELAALLEAELGAARVLKDMGGLLNVPGAGTAPLACGPRYLRLLRLEAPLGALAAALDAAAQDGKDPGEYTVRQLRWAFSELAHGFVLCEVHKFDSALRALPAFATLTTLPDDCAGPASAPAPDTHIEACGHCQDVLRRNPAYVQLPERHTRFLQDGVELAVRVRLSLARTALTDGEGGLDRALEEWDELVLVARRAGMQARAKKAVVGTVLGRVEALVDTGGAQRGECLDEAVKLVERVPAALHPLDRDLVDQLNARLSALLSMRGVWRGYTRTKYGMRSDPYGAETDLRRALQLNPASGHARDNLARALVFTLDANTTTIPGRLKILHEALGLLDVGLGQALTHGYRETLGEAIDELERLLAQDLGVEGLRELMLSDSEETAPDESELGVWAGVLTDRAEDSLARGDIRRALHHLMRATRADPMNSRIRRALLDTVQRWFDELTARSEGEESDEP
ncbi:CHAT domain-containing protein [Streptomyces sp. NPDC086554]|uniref:CHAT domain-containing protein n=1 Tax=Streptomyces sp. NPDC086554 TaxID=3154864 RepID=UPI0034268072